MTHPTPDRPAIRVLASGKGTSIFWVASTSAVLGLLVWMFFAGVATEAPWSIGLVTAGCAMLWVRKVRELFLFHGIEAHPSGVRIVDSVGPWGLPWKWPRARFVRFADIQGVTTDRLRVYAANRHGGTTTWIDIHTADGTIRVPERFYGRPADTLRQEILDLIEAYEKGKEGKSLDADARARRFATPVRAACDSPSTRLEWVASLGSMVAIVGGILGGIGYGVTWLGASPGITYGILVVVFLPFLYIILTSRRPFAYLELNADGFAIGRDPDDLELIPWGALASVHKRTSSPRDITSIFARPFTSGLDLRTRDGRLFEFRGSWTPPLDELLARLDGTDP